MPVLWVGGLAVLSSSLAFVLSSLRRGERARLAGQRSPARRVALAGLLAALAAVMQGSADFWPGPGHLLATFSTLPVAVGTMASPEGAGALFLAAAGLVALIHVHQAGVFLLTTGPLGMTAAWAALGGRPAWLRWFLPGATVGGGTLVMVHLLGIPAFGELTRGWGAAAATLFYVGFGFLYAPLWVVFLRRYWRRVAPVQARPSKGDADCRTHGRSAALSPGAGRPPPVGRRASGTGGSSGRRR